MLESNRLLMVKPQLSHAKELYQIHSNEEATLYTPKRRHKAITDTEKMLSTWKKYWDVNKHGYFIIIEKERNSVIGSGGGEKMKFAKKEYFNIYYRLNPEMTGHGYAYEAIETIINWLNSEVDATLEFVIRTDRNNLPSIKLAQRLGFKRDTSFDSYIDDEDIFFFKSL